MSLIFKRRMQERERKNGLADTYEVPNYYKPKEVEPPRAQQQQYMTMHEPVAQLNNVAYSIPSEIPKGMLESEGNLQPTESEIQKMQNFTQSQVPSWSIPAENYQEKNGNENQTAWESQTKYSQQVKDPTLISLPQGAYYDVPIVIDPASYQQQQVESFNATPQQAAQSFSAQLPCTNISCVHCKPTSSNTS